MSLYATFRDGFINVGSVLHGSIRTGIGLQATWTEEGKIVIAPCVRSIRQSAVLVTQ